MKPSPWVQSVRVALAGVLVLVSAACGAAAPASTSPAPATAPAGTGYHVYFTGPTPDHLEGGIHDAAIARAYWAEWQTVWMTTPR